jgi:hypothetical protein
MVSGMMMPPASLYWAHTCAKPEYIFIDDTGSLGGMGDFPSPTRALELVCR